MVIAGTVVVVGTRWVLIVVVEVLSIVNLIPAMGRELFQVLYTPSQWRLPNVHKGVLFTG